VHGRPWGRRLIITSGSPGPLGLLSGRAIIYSLDHNDLGKKRRAQAWRATGRVRHHPDPPAANLNNDSNTESATCRERLLGLITGPIASEAAPRGLVSSTTGIIVGSGEVLGGGIAPIIAGGIAQHYGIEHVLTMAMAGLALGVLVFLFLKETAPRKVGGVAAVTTG